MLKMYANGVKQDKPIRLVIFGLSHKNLEELRKGRPIKFNGAEAGLPADIEFLIFSGETERSMRAEFIEMVGPNTELKIDPKLTD